MSGLDQERLTARSGRGPRPRAAGGPTVDPRASGLGDSGVRSSWDRALERIDGGAVRAAARPVAVMLALLGANAALALAFVGTGELANGDQALLFRELMPGTLLSFVQLLAVAGIAWSIHRRTHPREHRPWHSDLWGLSAVVFMVFAVDEATQATLFVGKWLQDHAGVAPASGFNDVDSVILTLLFLACGLLLARHALVLRAYPKTVALLVPAVLLGGMSQALDSLVEPTTWEFVAEESLKMGAEVFFIGAFLAALHDLSRRRDASPEPDAGEERPATAPAR